MPNQKIKIAVLVSGAGTTLQNLIDVLGAGQLDAEICVVIGSRPGLIGIERAISAKFPTSIVDHRALADRAIFSRKVFSRCADAGVDLICMAGWLCLLDVPSQYAGRIINIHPSLLPSFGGKGMYGARVHQAVLDYGCKVSGCTVHFVDSSYDTGPIILQRACEVKDDDTAESLAHRVFEEEKIAYPQALRLIQSGSLALEGRNVRKTDPPAWSL